MFIASCNPKPCEEPPPPRGTTSAPGICARKENIRLVPRDVLGQGGQREMARKAQNIPSDPNPLGTQREGRWSLRHRSVRAGGEGLSPARPRAGLPGPPSACHAPVTGAKPAGAAAGMLGRSSGGKEGGKERAEHAGSRSTGGGDPLIPGGSGVSRLRGQHPPPQPGGHRPCRGRRVSPRSLGTAPIHGDSQGEGGGGSCFPERGARGSEPPARCPPAGVLPSHAVTAGRRFPGAARKVREGTQPGSRGIAPLVVGTHQAPASDPRGAAPGPEPVQCSRGLGWTEQGGDTAP